MHRKRLTFLPRILFFIAALALLIILNLIWVIPTIRAMYSSTSVLALEITQRARGNITSSLEAIQKELAVGAEEIVFEPNRKKIVIERILKDIPGIKSIGVAGRDGKETFLIDRFQFVMPADFWDYATTTYFSGALRGSASFSDVSISPALEPHIILATPVERSGIIDEVLIADINIRDLVSAIDTPEIKDGHIYAVDQDGYQILHPNLNEILRRPNFLARPIVKKVVQGRVIADGLAPDDPYTNEQNQNVFTVGIPVAVAGFSIFFEQSRSVALTGVRQIIEFAGITILLEALALFVIIRGRGRLQNLNVQLNELLKENYEVGKILVRRDRELTATNSQLENFLKELDDVGKMLVRRDLELTQANARLEELDKVKSEFVTIAAHQLRTPLTGIRWSYQTLMEEGGTAMTPGQLRIIQGGLGASLRMIDLVNSLLNVARIEEGRFGFRFTMQAPAAMIAHATEQAQKAAAAKGIRFVVQMPDHPISAFFFDEDKMTLVLDNMLDNAVKYTEPGGTITMEVLREGQSLKISVTDTGIGIPKDQMHRVFGKFFRADNALRFHTSGTGLGLYVCKNIVERHNGTMSVESVEGGGTTFTMALPMMEKR